MKRSAFLAAPPCAIVILVSLGCSLAGGDTTAQPASTFQHDDVAKQFGQHIMKADWAAAYAMTTPAYQATTSQAAMQKEYDDLYAVMIQQDATYKPNWIDVGHGDLPTDEKEAREDYHFKTVPPKSEWLAWLFCEIGEGDAQAMEQGLTAQLFVVKDNGQPKIAHVEFSPAD